MTDFLREPLPVQSQPPSVKPCVQSGDGGWVLYGERIQGFPLGQVGGDPGHWLNPTSHLLKEAERPADNFPPAPQLSTAGDAAVSVEAAEDERTLQQSREFGRPRQREALAVGDAVPSQARYHLSRVEGERNHASPMVTRTWRTVVGWCLGGQFIPDQFHQSTIPGRQFKADPVEMREDVPIRCQESKNVSLYGRPDRGEVRVLDSVGVARPALGSLSPLPLGHAGDLAWDTSVSEGVVALLGTDVMVGVGLATGAPAGGFSD